jgi:DNA mismatch endonuclease, patch repair protein
LDTLTREARSALMSRIRGKNTKPEIVVRKLLHAQGYRFRLHRRELPGTPDIVLHKYRVALFVHGCFFHSHAGCKLAYIPKTRTKFWRTKFAKNKKRDEKVKTLLRKAGWRPVVVWECETECPDHLIDHLQRVLEPEHGTLCKARFPC